MSRKKHIGKVSAIYKKAGANPKLWFFPSGKIQDQVADELFLAIGIKFIKGSTFWKIFIILFFIGVMTIIVLGILGTTINDVILNMM